MDNYDKYFDLIDGKLKASDLQDSIAFDFRNLVLSYYEENIGKVDISIKNKFFGLINYCLEGKNLQEAIDYKTDKDFEFSKFLSKDNYNLPNKQEGKILRDIYDKYKKNNYEWNLFKQSIRNFSLM
ncbi:MAG: hypothetical protein IKQ84_04410 [Spirochaetaceae bacterium]|nr:hypothetical protein [Spirochaetaceae bacterium]